MDIQLLVICILTFGINLIGTLAYAARIAGVRTRRIAMSFAVFNVLVLVSRTANGFLGPFLAKRIERRLLEGGGDALAGDFRLVLASASIAVFIGILLVLVSRTRSFSEQRMGYRVVLRIVLFRDSQVVCGVVEVRWHAVRRLRNDAEMQ